MQCHQLRICLVYGIQIIKNFVLKICKLKKNWIIGIEKKRIIHDLKNKIKTKSEQILSRLNKLKKYGKKNSS